MNALTFVPVGQVINGFNEPAHFHTIKDNRSTILIFEEYAEALLNIEQCEYIDVVFYLHKSEKFSLTGPIQTGEIRGVFASRSPFRPNAIGITTVKLIERHYNRLIVEGLDALNNSPVLDIKSADTSAFASAIENNPVHNAILKSDPRIEIKNNIGKKQTEILLIKAAQIHGHYCPGLAMGVMAAVHAINELQQEYNSPEEFFVIIDTSTCFLDGVQFVTGCTSGNKKLIINNKKEKLALTLVQSNKNGIRISALPKASEVIDALFPEYAKCQKKIIEDHASDPETLSKLKKLSQERAFGTLKIPFHKLFKITKIPFSKLARLRY